MRNGDAALALVLVLAMALPSRASADAPHVVWITGRPSADVAGRARRWSRRVARALDRAGAPVTSDDEQWAFDTEGTETSRVERLARIEALLHLARLARARLEQGRALAHLAEAERVALTSLDVPGASAWYAEVQIALAVTAAEIGEIALAEAALARASTTDPRRVLGAAEAPPDLVARAGAIARAVAIGPRGRFELRTSVEGAEVWLDGRRLGTAPLALETSVGAHVLRVEAPGHRTWARIVDVLEGGRPTLVLVLAPDAGLEAARRLREASDQGSVEGVVAALDALASLGRGPRALWLVETSEGAIDRAIVLACRAGGCSAPIRVDAERVESVMPSDPEERGEALDARGLVDARAWLDEPIPIEPPLPGETPWFEEPWPWLALGAVVIGAIGAAAFATWPQATTDTQITIDGSQLPGW